MAQKCLSEIEILPYCCVCTFFMGAVKKHNYKVIVAVVDDNHGCDIESGYNVFGGLPIIPMIAAQWRMKPKMTSKSRV